MPLRIKHDAIAIVSLYLSYLRNLFVLLNKRINGGGLLVVI
jgi:hypothetical protein